MNPPRVIERTIHFARRGRGASKELRADGQRPVPSIRVSRLARLMALALHLEALVRAGTVPDQAALARLGHVTRARISQILSLLHLAPDIQEQILFLTRPESGRDPLPLWRVRPLTAVVDWRKQRRLWRELHGTGEPYIPAGTLR